jgi:hypothetical protein
MLVHEPVGTYLPALANMSVVKFSRDASGGEVIGSRTGAPSAHDSGPDAPHRRLHLAIRADRAPQGLSGRLGQRGRLDESGAEFIAALAKLPLHYHWHHLGLQLRPRHRRPRHRAVAETAARRVLQDRFFGPLGMTDTAFTVRREKQGASRERPCRSIR